MDPRADTLREGYATVATAYADHLVDELAGKPLDRAWLTAFAEQAPAGQIVDVGWGRGTSPRASRRRGGASRASTCRPR